MLVVFQLRIRGFHGRGKALYNRSDPHQDSGDQERALIPGADMKKQFAPFEDVQTGRRFFSNMEMCFFNTIPVLKV